VKPVDKRDGGGAHNWGSTGDEMAAAEAGELTGAPGADLSATNVAGEEGADVETRLLVAEF